MAKLLTAATVAASVCFSAGVASANALFTVTEGNNDNRFLIAGSTNLEDASPNANGAFDLNDIAGLGTDPFEDLDVIGIYGRVVSSQDTFQYAFGVSEAFNVKFDLDGYDYIDGNGDTRFEANSGLVRQAVRGGPPTPGSPFKAVEFVLESIGVGNTLTEVGRRTFSTDILNGDNPFIFTAGPGSFLLTVNGAVPPSGDDDIAALYDLEIAAVPLPPAALLLGFGLAGVAGVRRMQMRRKAG
jgi:hypothetical protein